MFDAYEAGSDLTIMDAIYRYPHKDENTGKWDNGSITIVAKDNTTGKKIVDFIENPEYTYYVVKEKVLLDRNIDYNLKEIEKECCDPVTVPFKNLEKDIANRIGQSEYYKYNIETKNRANNKLLHVMSPNIMFSDMNIEDYYRFKFSKIFKNSITKISKAFIDIEVDGINMKGDFPEPGECPVNAVTFIDLRTNGVYTFLLRTKANEQISKFEKSTQQGTELAEFKELLLNHVGGEEQYKSYGLDKLQYHFMFFDEKQEIQLIGNLFQVINTLQPDFILAWNMAFDIPYLIQRIINLGYDPAEIMCHPDFPIKEAKYYIDSRAQIPSEKGDFATISSYSIYLDQLIQHASIRKGQSAYMSYKLDYVTNFICGFGKLDYSDITTNIVRLPYLNYQTFVFYNIIDVIDQLCIENKVNDIDFVFAKAISNNTRYSKIHRQTVYLMNRLASEYWDQGYICGNNKNKNNSTPGEKFAGAFVADPSLINDGPKLKINGKPIMVFDNLDDYDYRRLYPTMLQEFNMCDETQIGKLQIPEKIHDKENISNAGNGKFFSRDGAFFDDLAAHAPIEFCSRWFHLATFKEMLDDICEFFKNKDTTNMIQYIDRDGCKPLYRIVKDNTKKYTDVESTKLLDINLLGDLQNVYNNNSGFEITKFK